jgi:sirohydrochlorin ferrochelatase
VKAAFLETEVPRLSAALVKEAGLGHHRAIVVPLLLTDGYHARVRLAAEVDTMASSALPLSVRVARMIGPVDGPTELQPVKDLMVSALMRRLGEVALAAGAGRPDGIVLAAAGSPVSRCLATTEALARALGAAFGTMCRPGYTSLGRPTVAEAVASMRNQGARRVVVSTFLLAAGRRLGQAAADAATAGAIAMAPPLGCAPELVDIVLHRAAETAWDGAT